MGINWKELYQYRDLLAMFVRRDFLAIYSQTILGPLWFVVQPLAMAGVLTVAFSQRLNIQAPFAFFMTGIVLWTYFSDCVTKTASFFKDGSAIMSKVYFPRLIMPLAIVVTNLAKLGIQIGLLCLLQIITSLVNGESFIQQTILLFPLIVFITACLGLGAGLIAAALTIRYRDLSHLLIFGVQLLMFLSPVILPLESLQSKFKQTVFVLNPMSGLIEAFRHSFTGMGKVMPALLIYDALAAVLILFMGVVFLNRAEKTFVDYI